MLDKKDYRIAISMADSDFRSTLDAFLRVIAAAYIFPDHLEAKQLWRELSYGLCLANQSMHHGSIASIKPEEEQLTRAWLLSQFKVRINDVVDRHYKRYDGDDNQETSVYDTRLQADSQFYSY